MRTRKHPPEKHGTATQYLDGCRCDECREAHAEYARTYRALLELWEAEGSAYPFAEWLRQQLWRGGGEK